MKTINKTIAIFLFMFLVSCGGAPMYEKVYSFKDRIWHQGDDVPFEVDIENIEVPYDFTLFLRTTTSYPYNNLWVIMNTETPDGTTARESYEIKIQYPDGAWIGNRRGSIVETQLNFASRKLPMKGKYKFTIEQAITESEVSEVLDLALQVDPTE